MLRELIKKYKEILIYHDHQPLLLFWAVSDLFNNQVLWTDLAFWEGVGQPDTYYLYCVYLFISLGILFIYFVLWVWIYAKMKKEVVHRKVNG